MSSRRRILSTTLSSISHGSSWTPSIHPIPGVWSSIPGGPNIQEILAPYSSTIPSISLRFLFIRSFLKFIWNYLYFLVLDNSLTEFYLDLFNLFMKPLNCSADFRPLFSEFLIISGKWDFVWDKIWDWSIRGLISCTSSSKFLQINTKMQLLMAELW